MEIPKSICPIIDSYQKQWIPTQLLAFLPEIFKSAVYLLFSVKTIVYLGTYYKKYFTLVDFGVSPMNPAVAFGSFIGAWSPPNPGMKNKLES